MTDGTGLTGGTGLAGGTGPGEAECHGDVCVTCGDIAVEVTILRLLADGMAVVDTGADTAEGGRGTEEEVSVALISARPGDTILVHGGEAIAVVGRAGEVTT
jgi:hydrogenase expression/formation protein HypC